MGEEVDVGLFGSVVDVTKKGVFVTVIMGDGVISVALGGMVGEADVPQASSKKRIKNQLEQRETLVVIENSSITNIA